MRSMLRTCLVETKVVALQCIVCINIERNRLEQLGNAGVDSPPASKAVLSDVSTELPMGDIN